MIDARSWNTLIWADSAFPAGGASHSGGLEGALACGFVNSMASLAQWIADYLNGVFGPCDIAACVLSHRATLDADWHSLFLIDERVHALKVAREERNASAFTGERRLKVMAATESRSELTALLEARREGKWQAHVACVWGVTGALGAVSEQETALAFAYNQLAGIVSAAVRMRLGGQQAAQQVMNRISGAVVTAIDRACAVDNVDDLASYAPRLELAQMFHERQRVRLFMS